LTAGLRFATVAGGIDGGLGGGAIGSPVKIGAVIVGIETDSDNKPGA
jgi:hypothetical protein